MKLFGVVSVKGEMESHVTVSVDIDEFTKDKSMFFTCFTRWLSKLGLIAYYPSNSVSVSATDKKVLQFTPPGNYKKSFELLSYEYSAPFIPLRGFYQLIEKGNNNYRLLVQLKLDSRANNFFSHFDVYIPLNNKYIQDLFLLFKLTQPSLQFSNRYISIAI